MLSTLTQSVRRKFHPEISSTGRSTRTVTFPEERRLSGTQKKSFFRYRDDGRQPPRDADHDDEDEEEDVAEDADEEEESEDICLEEESPLLPIFSSDHLNTLPVFSFTHTFREMVIERCDTVLTWEQLRSPQVSQFLVKPVQQEIREHHLSAATQYALLANCMQFNKEARLQPGNSGTNRTRAMICELIAMRMIRECGTRELIDALSYDFDPLQGQPVVEGLGTTSPPRRATPRSARISCIEIAIRANAKRFLAHPLVVQHLEAIWNGSIVFHSAADSMHRRRIPMFHNSYGTHRQPSLSAQPVVSNNRTATLYNPREASLFKLSRLRVPRYRNILSTISFAILLVLFLAVLEDRPLVITPMEILFWVWATGYMLDEVIGFNEQGFSLYIASFWNTFDVGILLLLFVYLCLRLYGVAIPDDDLNKMHITNRAYDVLAASAVLLFPRLFSVLDHYRYFSQLIIAFRMMAADMLAIFVLIVIFCSGFLVALTFAFSKGKTEDPKAVAYALLQMLLGFTPAAWDRWDDYNWLGRTVMTLFLFICHFVVVTILITVLTNSFMEIVRNANEEHQYLFAVNVISNVKSDALFAYVPPTNVLQWLVTPLRYCLPFRQYVKVNRTIIKVTHLPILWTIYLYERLVLRQRYIEPIDLVESRGRRVRKTLTERLPRLIREPSIATFRQEAALEEVFRQPADTTMRTARSQERRKSTNVVSSWMHHMVDEDADPPQEEDYKIVDKLERRRFGSRRLLPSNPRNFSANRRAMSVVSDPTDMPSPADFFSPLGRIAPSVDLTPSAAELPSQQTDADGDDELVTNDEDTEINVTTTGGRHDPFTKDGRSSLRRDYFASRMASQVRIPPHHDSDDSAGTRPNMEPSARPESRRDDRPKHARNVSSATMIYNPPAESDNEDLIMHDTISASPKRTFLGPVVGSQSPSSKPSTNVSGRKTPKRLAPALRAHPGMPNKDNVAFRSTPDFSNIYSKSKPTDIPQNGRGKRRSSLEMDLISDIGDNKAIGGGYVGAIPASFASQMAHATNAMRQSQLQMQQQEQQRRNDDNEMFSRLMMARMNTLEEGFREVVHEVRESVKIATSGLVSRQRSPERDVNVQKRPKDKRFRERQERTNLGSGATSVISADDRPRTAGSASGKDKAAEPTGPVKSSSPSQEPASHTGGKEDS